MTDVLALEPAIDPNNRITFLLDWELTLKCNLDCSYCDTGIYGGHDNSTKHPPAAECLSALDFMFEYVDLYMSTKPSGIKYVILNVYGGESLFHPDIVEILRECHSRHEKYQDRWYLTITCTTNAVVGAKRWAEIVPFIDEFTVSYHAENLLKQKQQYLDNVLYLKTMNKRFKCVVMMHNREELFTDAESIINFCKEQGIRHVVKPLDNTQPEWQYTGKQYGTLKTYWMSPITVVKDQVQAIQEGRSCCGGRKLSLNGNLKSSVGFVPKQGFEGWSCSVNWFFLFVRQLDGAVYTNKDCLMSTTGKVEPLGNINNAQKIISTLKAQLETKTMPIIKCKKNICRCGFCAPKAENEQDFRELIKRNVPVDVFLKEC